MVGAGPTGSSPRKDKCLRFQTIQPCGTAGQRPTDRQVALLQRGDLLYECACPPTFGAGLTKI
jgi:hypothetical protein